MSSSPRTLAILGSTGSIGTQALQIVAAHPDRFRVVALAAGSNAALLAQQAAATGASHLGLAQHDAGSALSEHLSSVGLDSRELEVHLGPDAAAEIAALEVDMVLNGMTGSIGLKPTLAAVERGTTVALANKESLIVGGELLRGAVESGLILPVDSEHSALWQAMTSGTKEEIARLILTASGGPFRGRSAAELAEVTPAQALAHPTWNMGRVVTTNSATMVNKALEVIEAHLLFSIPLERIDVVVHPQSVVHSMVQYVDGSILAQASPPDMRLPIALALGHPERVPEATQPCDFAQAVSWSFEPLDEQVFGAVRLAKQAAAASGTHMAVYNAANEQAVEAFHEGRLGFLEILQTVDGALQDYAPQHQTPGSGLTLEAVLEAERWARTRAEELIRAASEVRA
ncbi:1-deoxy-D-xylulose-5-phosphate reductoisomerase [Nesterenkonia flava]|uniref:1-deoxy-D-xylulose 5-phosphate reductoisomerase n=1 Tax=Nesterenkonia flava TaxID=469799 RepID=A0ABU1FR38_9MICC|nr:1-deoxy-D-xylulose-5-phosphate reductoisomerase [Nesterenkonia flava]MDR5711118.1 1-deoxy-D-xylulose-5-phosphate reductoisomerase [Nesterenkonia flava]